MFSLYLRLARNETILWPAWRHREVKTNAVNNFSTELSTKYHQADKADDGWILDIAYGNSSLDIIEEINSRIASSLTEPSTKANVIPLDFAFSSNLVDISLNVNHQKALAKQNFIVIDL
jgi:hypothetical protein